MTDGSLSSSAGSHHVPVELSTAYAASWPGLWLENALFAFIARILLIEIASEPESPLLAGSAMASAWAAFASSSLLQYQDQFQPPGTAPPQPRIGP